MTRQQLRLSARIQAWAEWRGQERHRQMWDHWHPCGLGSTRSTRRELARMVAHRDWRSENGGKAVQQNVGDP